MKRGAWLRRRFKLVQGRLDNMFKRRDSAVVVDDAADAADAVAQHRAEAEAKLEGRIQPLVPVSQGTNTMPRRRNSHAVRESNGARTSLRHSRHSFVSQHFAMAAVTAGCGQGLGWSMADVQTSHPDESLVVSRENMFREDGEHIGRTFVARSNKRKSQFWYSILDPSMGLGEGAHHNDDAAYSEQANYIRDMMESGNFDLHQFGLSKDAIDDPNFQTALHAALESFPPGMAAQIIEAAATREEGHDEEVKRPVSSIQKARFSIAIASKTAWHDLRRASNRWSRVGARRDSDIKLYEKPRFSSRVWSRVSWGKKKTSYMAY
ncbi:hypothetical protein SCUP234_05005 [Seiridium cupressi]